MMSGHDEATDGAAPEAPHEAIGELEQRIEALAERAEQGRKLARAARFATWAGALLLCLLAVGALGRSPGLLIAGLIAMLGGIALGGSNRGTLGEIEEEIAALERRRAELIDAAAPRPVPPA